MWKWAVTGFVGTFAAIKAYREWAPPIIIHVFDDLDVGITHSYIQGDNGFCSHYDITRTEVGERTGHALHFTEIPNRGDGSNFELVTSTYTYPYTEMSHSTGEPFRKVVINHQKTA
jgi:hypothetical protein